MIGSSSTSIHITLCIGVHNAALQTVIIQKLKKSPHFIKEEVQQKDAYITKNVEMRLEKHHFYITTLLEPVLYRSKHYPLVLHNADMVVYILGGMLPKALPIGHFSSFPAQSRQLFRFIWALFEGVVGIRQRNTIQFQLFQDVDYREIDVGHQVGMLAEYINAAKNTNKSWDAIPWVWVLATNHNHYYTHHNIQLEMCNPISEPLFKELGISFSEGAYKPEITEDVSSDAFIERLLTLIKERTTA